MRLLKQPDSGELSLTEDLSDDKLPKYAMLSHIWRQAHEEVSHEDFTSKTGESKPGYEKIRFCQEQAARHGLTHFWIDTCCIDRSKYGEVPMAINSMFSWYGNSTKCFVYLEDVSDPDTGDSSWEQEFRNSRWFRRGWTLQELLAPLTVIFFSKNGKELGTKQSLERQICEITGIHPRALHGSPLSEFSIVDRLAWTKNRETTYEEDMVYSLLGVFDVHLSPCYGEGREKAFHRLNEQIESDLKGPQFNDFSISFSLSDVAIAEQFVAREKELTDMHKTLRGDGSRRAIALHGLGGIGKTQMAVAYAKRHRHSYSAVFWLYAKSDESLKQSFCNTARKILRQYPSAREFVNVDMKDLDQVVDTVKAWLCSPSNTRWLLIYDNYDNPRMEGNEDENTLDIQKYLPESYQGSIIITTRLAEVKIGTQIAVQCLNRLEDSLQILSNTSKRQNLIRDPDALQLAEKLDGFPLALATAGAYLEQVTTTFADYLRLWNESWLKLQKASPKMSTYQYCLYSTWQISFDRVRKHSEYAARLLKLWAYFDKDDIWWELLRHRDSNDPEWFRELTKDEINFNQAMQVLRNHGLVEVSESPQECVESRGYSMHTCVHQWTVCVLNQGWDQAPAELALRCVALRASISSDTGHYQKQRRLLQHVAACSRPEMAHMSLFSDLHIPYRIMGILESDQAKLEMAETIVRRALQAQEKAFGTKHPLTELAACDLGRVLQDQGKQDEARRIYLQALAGLEKTLGAEHEFTLNIIQSLGDLYRKQGKLEMAEEMYLRALQGFKKALGPEHRLTLETNIKLGSLYVAQGNPDEAEKVFLLALQGLEKTLGAEHPFTLMVVSQASKVYEANNKLDKAEKMCMRALRGFEKTLGADNDFTLMCVCMLGTLYARQGEIEEAKQVYWRVIQGYEKVLGRERSQNHIVALTAQDLYATLLQLEGFREEAEVLSRALADQIRSYGPSHPELQHMQARLNAVRDELNSKKEGKKRKRGQ